MIYEWDSNLETGNSLIDGQHKQLIAALNALSAAYFDGRGQEEVERTMDFLVGYTCKHFADEEKIQQKYDYPDYLEHKRLHEEFKRVTQGLLARQRQEGVTDEFVSKVYVTVGEWLLHHIGGDDFKMAVYMRNNLELC